MLVARIAVSQGQTHDKLISQVQVKIGEVTKSVLEEHSSREYWSSPSFFRVPQVRTTSETDQVSFHGSVSRRTNKLIESVSQSFDCALLHIKNEVCELIKSVNPQAQLEEYSRVKYRLSLATCRRGHC